MKSDQTVLLLVVVVYLCGALADERCPMNLDYVGKLQWDKSSCKSHNISGGNDTCCNTLHILFGVGLAQNLRDTSKFELPSNASAVACLKIFQTQLDSLRLSQDLVAICLKNMTSEFVTSPSLCDGIETKQNWTRSVNNTDAVDSACAGDLSDSPTCSECNDKLSNMYLSNPRNKGSKCVYFALLYAAGVVNKFGPKTRGTAECILKLPFKTASRRPVLAYALLGAVPAVLIG